MTEKEVVDYLKENRTKGVAYAFMPEEVKNFCRETNSSKFIGYQNIKGWIRVSQEYDFKGDDIIALPKDFELKEKPKGGWVEIDIEDDGKFRIDDEEERSAPARETYNWFDWQDFLKDSRFYRRDFTAFGGWQYKNCKAWFLQPMLSQEDTYIHSEFEGETYDCKPAIPVKIRFWREVK